MTTHIDRELARSQFGSYISAYIRHYASTNGIRSAWGDPIVGFADAASPGFGELKEVHPGHRLPEDVLPGATVVVSYFLPFLPEISQSNIAGDRPSEDWAAAYEVTDDMAEGLNRYVEDLARSTGAEARTPDWIGEDDEPARLLSQRRIAELAGIGTLGINTMLITHSGCCGRCYSVVTTMDMDADAPLGEERCLFKRDGSCGKCIGRCVCGAIAPEGFDRGACFEVCNGNAPESGRSICGKCAIGVPCSYRDPSERRWRRRTCST